MTAVALGPSRGEQVVGLLAGHQELGSLAVGLERAFAGRAQATCAATQALRATLGPRPSDLDAVLSIVDQIPRDQPAAHRRREPEGGERWQLQGGRDEREHRDTGREPAGADVSRSLARRVPDEVDQPDPLDDVRQEVEGEAAAERGCRDHTQRLIDVLDGCLQPEGDRTIPAIIGRCG